ncbi:MAG: Asp-tRNA(Asn)/Glu-tRNA(Gln) amidotransferase subunit GatC [Candidatus Pacearchaeota archaeon]
MEIDNRVIENVAEVARLHLSDSEKKKFIPQLKEVLENFSKLDEVDTEGVNPAFHPIIIRNILREDIIEPSLKQEEALQNTKLKKDGYFKGPKAI